MLQVFATALGVSIIVVAGVLFGTKLDQVISNAIFFALFIFGGLYFTQKRFRRTKARLDEQGQSLMFLRYPKALPGSLSGVWQMGVAVPTPGRIDFQPSVYDELIPSGRSRALTGLHLTGMPPRIAGRNDQKQGVPFGSQIITMESDGGIIEVAASPATVGTIMEAVDGSVPGPESGAPKGNFS